ncbi:uncharacterized protein LOC129289913 [Prosopis cineraria]|uniref:uncharacterized protein LOC129289913 n=1 Tax=Prosopis cineraria TaxID=364024 RepID=UPI00241002F4|nr:uncharacterized protein LOC129289913 [Prosopis cineraria]
MIVDHQTSGLQRKRLSFLEELYMMYLEALDIEMLDIVTKGPYIPMIIRDDGLIREKSKDEWSDKNKQLVNLNAKAKLTIAYALNRAENYQNTHCIIAKKMWDALRQAHEGINGVKENIKSCLIHEYETFKMKDRESIKEI